MTVGEALEIGADICHKADDIGPLGQPLGWA